MQDFYHIIAVPSVADLPGSCFPFNWHSGQPVDPSESTEAIFIHYPDVGGQMAFIVMDRLGWHTVLPRPTGPVKDTNSPWVWRYGVKRNWKSNFPVHIPRAQEGVSHRGGKIQGIRILNPCHAKHFPEGVASSMGVVFDARVDEDVMFCMSLWSHHHLTVMPLDLTFIVQQVIADFDSIDAKDIQYWANHYHTSMRGSIDAPALVFAPEPTHRLWDTYAGNASLLGFPPRTEVAVYAGDRWGCRYRVWIKPDKEWPAFKNEPFYAGDSVFDRDTSCNLYVQSRDSAHMRCSLANLFENMVCNVWDR